MNFSKITEGDTSMKKMKMQKGLDTRIIVLAIVVVLCAVSLIASSSEAGKAKKMDTPTIVCADTGAAPNGPLYIDIGVTAGATTGAPAGFSLQWMTQGAFDSNGGWLLSDNPNLCKGSFSGNAFSSNYNLVPGESVTVRIGDLLLDNGAAVSGINCANGLVCGTTYVFHAFAHATSSIFKSDLTPDITCSTLPCTTGGFFACSLTQGYWKTHNDIVCASDPLSPLCIAWPVTQLNLGSVNYSQSQLISIFNQSAAGNGLVNLAHQLIAAKLNVERNISDPVAQPNEVKKAIADADTLIGALVVPPVGTGSLLPKNVGDLVNLLDSYNNGAIGPGHCDDLEQPTQ